MSDLRAASGVGQVLVKTNTDPEPEGRYFATEDQLLSAIKRANANPHDLSFLHVSEADKRRDAAAEAKRLRKAAKRAAIEARRDNNRV